MKHLLNIFTLFILTSCHFHGPVDKSVMKKITKEPPESDFLGRWEVDSFSYDLIKEQYELKDQKVELIFNENGKFQAINFPDFVNDGFGKSISGNLINATGDWEIKPDNDTWILDVGFADGEIVSSSYDLYKMNNELVIWLFIGDPDQADRLMFTRNKK